MAIAKANLALQMPYLGG